MTGDGGRPLGCRVLAAAAELDDVAAVAFRRAVGGDRSELLHGLALGGELEARFFAGFGFSVEGLGDGGGAAHLAEGENLDVEFAALIADVEHVVDADVAGWLGLDFVGVDAAEIAGL